MQAEVKDAYWKLFDTDGLTLWVCDFYNKARRHSSCGMKSPIDYENSAILEAA